MQNILHAPRRGERTNHVIVNQRTNRINSKYLGTRINNLLQSQFVQTSGIKENQHILFGINNSFIIDIFLFTCMLHASWFRFKLYHCWMIKRNNATNILLVNCDIP